jgi:TonB family protein
MTRALLYQSGHKWRFGVALGMAVLIHFAAIGFATVRKDLPAVEPGFIGEPPIITVETEQPNPEPAIDDPEPLPTPPAIDPLYFEEQPTPPPVHRQNRPVTPITKQSTNIVPRSSDLSSAKVLALSAPRPEYPYEARRQRITGDGVALMTIDPASGNVTGVTMAKSTGNAFLDNAATAGFRRWRFRPGTVSSVTCPVTFTLSGVSY